jgi:hypothetical protein
VARELQKEKAYLPIEVTEEGIDSEERDEQCWKE